MGETFCTAENDELMKEGDLRNTLEDCAGDREKDSSIALELNTFAEVWIGKESLKEREEVEIETVPLDEYGNEIEPMD